MFHKVLYNSGPFKGLPINTHISHIHKLLSGLKCIRLHITVSRVRTKKAHTHIHKTKQNNTEKSKQNYNPIIRNLMFDIKNELSLQECN